MTALTHESLLANFPFENIREAQSEALEKIARTHQEGKRFTVLEMPTGAGKSPVSFAVAQTAAQMPYDDGFHPGAHITTTQIILQRQYLRDFESRGLREIKGKANYMCGHYDGGGVVDCATASALHSEEDQCGSCTYSCARQDYLDSPIGVTNFAYFTTIRKTGVEKLMPSRLYLIVDEAHNTEAELIGFGEVDITQGRLSILDLDRPIHIDPEWSNKRKMEVSQKWLSETVLPKVKQKRTHFMSKAHQASDRASTVKFVKMAEGLEQFKHKIDMFLGSGSEEPWVVYNQTSPRGQAEGLTMKPLYANQLAEQYLFNAGKNILLMSATILGPRVFARNLGIDVADMGFKRFPSDFPIDNRLVHFDPAGSMSFKNIDKTLPAMAKRVEKAARAHGDEKGLVHANSYKVCKAIVEHLESCGLGKRVITHNSDKGSRDAAVARHLASPEPTILISPSLTEGLDLAGDLSRWQVITKVPYPSLGDLWIKTRMEEDSEWYQWRTALTVIQATGRSVRSREDHATTYIFDSDFGRLMNQASHLFPSWWKEALVG